MYYANGVAYNEEHTISFGNLIKRTSGGITHTDFVAYANTWADWHLIPSSLPIIANSSPSTKYIEIPGSDGMLDFSDYLVGRPTYSRREGTLNFIIDINQEKAESVREKMMNVLHGKKVKMCLMDDPTYYYEGRLSIGSLVSGRDYPQISINYNLEPYKYLVQPYGSEPIIWDTFNFETDYDYSVLYPNVTVSGTTKSFRIYAFDMPVTPIASWISGSVTCSFGGVSKTLSSDGNVQLGTITNANDSLNVSGTGSVLIEWRGGSL